LVLGGLDRDGVGVDLVPEPGRHCVRLTVGIYVCVESRQRKMVTVSRVDCPISVGGGCEKCAGVVAVD